MYVGGYGEIINVAHVVHLERLSHDNQLEYLKGLWQEDPKKYYEWKEECIEMGELSDLFGTKDNPTSLDESNL